MRSITAAMLAGLWLASSGAALAQVATGYEVQVNPVAPGNGMLLYPGGQYARAVPLLRQPGDTNRPIALHMPTRRHRAVTADITGSDPVQPRRRVARAAPTPPPAPSAPEVPGYVPLNSAASMFGGATVSGQAAPRTQVARANPAPSVTNIPGLSKRSMILFAANAPDPSADSLSAIKFLASDLNDAMSGPSARIQLQAFGGAKGDKGSDARRLSLKRALAIRQVLIDDGVSPDRIDVRAMGGADDGPADRVDVYLKS